MLHLGMRLIFGRTFPMFSEQVDEVWHASLLFTDLYAELWRAFAEAYWGLYGEPGYLWTIRSPVGAALTLDGRVTLKIALGGAGHDT